MSTPIPVYLVIPGEPGGKGRPKFTRTGHAYTPAKTVNHEATIKQIFADRYPDYTPLVGPLKMVVYAHLAIPQSASRRDKELMRGGMIRPTKRPDIDNLLKLVADALSGLAYADDKNIVWADIRKFYSERPRLEIAVEKEGVHA